VHENALPITLTTEVIIYPYTLIIIQKHFMLQTTNPRTTAAQYLHPNKWTQSVSSHKLFRIIFNNILQSTYVHCGFLKHFPMKVLYGQIIWNQCMLHAPPNSFPWLKNTLIIKSVHAVVNDVTNTITFTFENAKSTQVSLINKTIVKRVYTRLYQFQYLSATCFAF
jgi:hypothetical protein